MLHSRNIVATQQSGTDRRNWNSPYLYEQSLPSEISLGGIFFVHPIHELARGHDSAALGLLQPLARLGEVPRRSGSGRIEPSKVELGGCEARLGRLAVPVEREFRIGLHAAAGFVEFAGVVLRRGVARARCLQVEPRGARRVRLAAHALRV